MFHHHHLLLLRPHHLLLAARRGSCGTRTVVSARSSRSASPFAGRSIQGPGVARGGDEKDAVQFQRDFYRICMGGRDRVFHNLFTYRTFHFTVILIKRKLRRLHYRSNFLVSIVVLFRKEPQDTTSRDFARIRYDRATTRDRVKKEPSLTCGASKMTPRVYVLCLSFAICHR